MTSPTLQAQLTDTSVPVSSIASDDLRSRRFFANRYVSSTKEAQNSSAGRTSLVDASAIRKLKQLLVVHSYNFISPSQSWVDQAQWERGAQVDIIQDKPVLTVSASLIRLTREFCAHVIFSSFLSTSFVEANSGFVADFFQFSLSYNTFMIGLPYWIAPGLGPPALAREKCLLALDSLVEAIYAEIDGNSMTGTGAGMLYDLDHVHEVVWDVVKQSRMGGSSGRQVRKCSCEILEAIWTATFKSVNVIVWVLMHLFEKESENGAVLEQVRTEIKKVVKAVKPAPSGLPFEDPPRLEFAGQVGHEELEKQCPTLYGAILEVLRLETEPEAYLMVDKDFILTADATPDPTSTKKPALLSNVVERTQLVRGDCIYAAYGAVYRDASYWDRPRRFAPKRYASADGATTTQARLPKNALANHFNGESLCMYIIMALLSLYELQNVKHPGSRIVAGVGVPKGDLKATITRRKI